MTDRPDDWQPEVVVFTGARSGPRAGLALTRAATREFTRRGFNVVFERSTRRSPT